MTGSLQRRNLISLLAVGAVLALIFSNAENWNFNDGIVKEALFLAFDLFLVVLLPLFFLFNKKAGAWLNQVMDKLREAISKLWENRIQTAKYAGICAAGIPVSWGLSYGVSALLQIENNMILQWSVLAVVFLAIAVWLLRKQAATKPELLFFVITMILGIYMIEVRPVEVGYSWDDQEHFERTVSLATLNGPYYEADESFYLNAWEPASKASETERAERTEFLNTSFENKIVRDNLNHGNLRHISLESYIPYAAGIIFGRGIGLKYISALKCGLFFNLLFYAAVMAWAMSKLKFGRILIAVIALFPTNMYMVTSFSYDPWITAWITLAFAYFFSYLQEPGKILSGRDMGIILWAFILGCLPKAIYFVLMFPLLFMPKDHFESISQQRKYITLVFMTAFLLAGTFLLPMLVGGAGSGDARGGSEVDATGQIKYILANPLEYAKTLFGFMTSEFLNVTHADRYIVNYAYMGMADEMSVPTGLVLLGVMFTDHNGKAGKTLPVLLSSMFAFFCMAVLIATAMYISFTPVGLNTVNGCQHRYLIPMVFPALYMHSIDRFENRMNLSFYNVLPMLAMALMTILSLGSRLYMMY